MKRIYNFLLLCLFVNFSGCSKQQTDVPGVAIDYSPPHSKIYIGSPSIAILPDGDYVASHDFFGPNSTTNLTRVFRSTDRGLTWQKLTDLKGQFWSSLFVHQENLYILGTNKQYGSVIIRRSQDGGVTWTEPKDKDSGLLFDDEEYHTAPVPVLVHNGRIWRAMEDRNPPEKWGVNFRAFVMSAPVESDLLRAENWTVTNRLRYNQDWPGRAWLEGNVVVAPDGQFLNILRNDTKTGGKAAVTEISFDGKTASFDPQTGFINFPGGSKKFTIRFDPVSNLYWSLSNYILPEYQGENPERTRNTLALISSTDLRTWKVRSIILTHADVKLTGFQYVDWQFEDKDIIAVCRTAWQDDREPPHNCHDANYLTFHRIENFRELD